MPLAELHGKLPGEVRRSEDALTGSVFNLLTLLPPERGLLPWLNLAENLAGTRVGLPPRAEVDAAFWPLWKDGAGRDCEPDVVLGVYADGCCTAVLVEVKYLSGLSGWPTSPDAAVIQGQLGREWQALHSVGSHELPGSPGSTTRRLVIFVTPDPVLPRATLAASVAEIDAKSGGTDVNIFWLSWFSLGGVVENCLREHAVPRWERLALERLLALLVSRRLVVFSGIERPAPVQVLWSYAGRYVDSVEPIATIPWSYES